MEEPRLLGTFTEQSCPPAWAVGERNTSLRNLSYRYFEAVTRSYILSCSVWGQQKGGGGDGKPAGSQDSAMFPAIAYRSGNKSIMLSSLSLTPASLSLSQLFLPAGEDKG